MYNLMIVDDEKLIRTAISTTIDWKSLGISKIFLAEDGEIALNISNENIIDICITDIKMPFMDGITLSKHLLEKSPITKIIILTGHDEFVYAQQAIKIGITDYILKPITKDNLILTIKKTIDNLKDDRENFEKINEMREKLQKMMPILKERVLNALIDSKSIDKEILSLLNYTKINIEAKKYTIALLNLGFLEEISIEKMEINNLMFLEYIEKFFDMENYIVFSKYQGYICIIIKNMDMEKKCIREIFCEKIEIIRKEFNSKISNCYVNCAIGSNIYDIKNINTSYLDALNAINYKTFKGNNKTYDIYEYGYSNIEFVFPDNLISDILDAISIQNNWENPICELEDFLSKCTFLNKDNLKMIGLDIYFKICKILINFKEISHFTQYVELFLQIETIYDLSNLLKKLCIASQNIIEKSNISASKLLIEKAKNYILNNYSDPDLCLQNVADHIYINSSYLSSLFKKEAKKPFIDYLTQIRIEKACQIMNIENLKNHQIAYRVGYKDPHYFGICFKKIMGKTPTEYRKS